MAQHSQQKTQGSAMPEQGGAGNAGKGKGGKGKRQRGQQETPGGGTQGTGQNRPEELPDNLPGRNDQDVVDPNVTRD